MATRRSRIKGIANIPQRRKVDNKSSNQSSTSTNETHITDLMRYEELPNITDSDDNSNLAKNREFKPIQHNILSQTITTVDSAHELVIHSLVEESPLLQSDANVQSTQLNEKTVPVKNCKSIPSQHNIAVETVTKLNEDALHTISNTDPAQELVKPVKDSLVGEPALLESDGNLQFNEMKDSKGLHAKKIPIKNCDSIILPNATNDQEAVKISHRRTFIKPLVNLKSLIQKPKSKVIEPESTPNSTNTQIANTENKMLCNPLPNISTQSVSVSDGFSAINSNSENENTTEPQNPAKVLNRSRIKAVPRLHQRRISSTIHGSASESEDDTKKSFKRIKTDSICSTASSSHEHQFKTDPDVPQKNKDFSSVIQRKCKRTEQSNKMAEARRNFISKFRNETPDKHELTMLDLIFYNPSTKPMSQKSEKSEDKKIDTEKSNSPVRCDSLNQRIESDDDDNIIPAPQIKIGANGEIIVDEQSLIIENKQTKKDRENLQKSQLVDGDFDTGYGIYKRAKRSKDWSKEETLFFYKALNTLGTDFSLMAQLFPERTRRELKLKFKKEEKINNALVDKALIRPLQFNISELKEEVANRKKRKEREEMEKEERLKELKLERKGAVLPYIQKGYRPRKKLKRSKRKHKDKDIYSSLERGIASVCESNSEDEDDLNETSTESALTNILKPTRYGRIPKQNQSFNLDDTKIMKPEEQAMQESKDLEPGSLMIVSCQTPVGLPTIKVFIVTASQTKVPIVLPPEVINNLTQNVSNSAVQEITPEHNYTICHDASESVQTEHPVASNSDLPISKNNSVPS